MRRCATAKKSRCPGEKPRPDVHERLDRALTKIRPDVVISCYGMNDGIYYPFGQERFEAYQNGVNRLIEKVHGAGAKLILLTPPPFDPLPLRGKGRLKKAGEEAYSYSAMYEGYDDVLARYSRWILAQSDRVEGIVDVRTPLVEYVARERKRDPQFTLSPDGVHPNAEGHRLLGETILRAWQVVSTTPPGDDLLELASKRASLLHYAWLSEVGHRRPGVQPGLPLAEAREQARQLENQIRPLVAKRQESTYADRSSGRGTVYQLHYPGMLRAGELRLSVDYMLWLPQDVTHLRGVIVHQHGCGRGASLGGRTAADDLHWQALRKWDCALMGSSYDPRDGIDCRMARTQAKRSGPLRRPGRSGKRA